jgi:hypothetical protein
VTKIPSFLEKDILKLCGLEQEASNEMKLVLFEAEKKIYLS